jgi:signal transduction histidine kinase
MKFDQGHRASPLPSGSLLRIAGLAAWAMIGVLSFGAGSSPPDAGFNTTILRSLMSVCLGGFGLAFWYNTRVIPQRSIEPIQLALLAFQAATGFIFNTDLLYIVAAEIPLVLPSRVAVYWMAGQSLLLMIWIYWLDRQGFPLEFPTLPGLPHALAILMSLLFVLAFQGFAFYAGHFAATESRGRREAERMNAELLATRELLAQSSRMAERGYIAQELHDTLGHHLVALKLNLEWVQQLTEGQVLLPLRQAQVLVGGLLSEVREMVSGIRVGPSMNLRQTLQILLAGVSELTVQLVFPDDLEITDPGQAHALFRCVQESVTNAIKHAEAKTLQIEFSHDDERIYLRIHDDGLGTVRLTPGHGLKGMRERLEAVGGKLEIQTGQKRGFTLHAWVPKAEEY